MRELNHSEVEAVSGAGISTTTQAASEQVAINTLNQSSEVSVGLPSDAYGGTAVNTDGSPFTGVPFTGSDGSGGEGYSVPH